MNMDRTGTVKEAHFMDVDEQAREVVMATFY